MPKHNGPLRIGVYVVPPVQFLDVSPIDILGSMSKEYMAEVPLPDAVKSQALDIQIKYISPAGPSKEEFARMTASAGLRIDHSIHDAEVQPGSLDVIMIPGPPPDRRFSQEELDFLRRHWNKGNGVTVLSVCTGSRVVAESGIADGLQGSAPRNMLSDFRKLYPGTKWLDKRYVRDPSGKLWMSGGITNGQDMVAAFARELHPGSFTEIILAMTDIEGRGEDYGSGQAVNAVWWVYTLLKTWFASKSRSKTA